MKFASLLAHFLYTNKRLDLSGIGSFLLDPSLVTEVENTRQGKPVLLEGVSFENNSAVKQSPELIEFIALQTGKIKALAAADLESHLELAKQFLNIGKPFMFEGIGSLSKMQAGGFSFTPGQVIAERMRDMPARDTSPALTEEPASDYRSIFYTKKVKTNWKKPAIIFLLLGGIILAVWGGYTVYKRTMAKKSNSQPEEKKEDRTVLLPDTLNNVNNTSSQTATNTNPATIPVPAGNYKFVVETAVRERALKRYGTLTKIGVKNVQMETTDSLSFKLYFIIPATPADTAHILDSLRRNYTPPGSRAYVE